MPYTNPWNVTDPPGTEQAKNIDNHIRKLRVDINDRLASLVVDINADPIDMKPQYKGNVVGKRMVIPFSSFNSNTAGKEASYFAGYLNAFSDTGPLIAPVILAPGCTITLVELLADKGDTTSVEWDLYSRAFAAGGTRGTGSLSAQVSAIHISDVGVGVRLSTSGVLALAITDAFMYYIAVEALGPVGNSFDLFGARVTYTTPDSRNTL